MQIEPEIDENSIVYSFGIGKDISFDESLISTYNMKIWGFDPTPDSIEWINHQSVTPKFIFSPWGIDSKDSITKIYPPSKKELSSYSILKRTSIDRNKTAIPVEMKRLQTIMKHFNHTNIDILKLDIEGAEYRVIQDIYKSNIRPNQILLEFHHHNPPLSIFDTYYAINLLGDMRYIIGNISER